MNATFAGRGAEVFTFFHNFARRKTNDVEIGLNISLLSLCSANMHHCIAAGDKYVLGPLFVSVA